MGASFFQETRRAKSLSEAYRDAVDMAIEEYGNDGYNGTISTTHGVRDVTKDFKESKKSPNEYVNLMMDKISKRECWAICVEEPKKNTNKTKTKVEHIIEKGTKKWVLKYCVYKGWRADELVGSYNTKGDAIKAARAYTERTQESTQILIEKKLEKSSNTVAKITYKPSSTEKNGKWVFFGWAAE